jgi:hypothetical protein
MPAQYKPGECVVYRKTKYTTHPGRRATRVWPTPNGDYYSYCVEKYYRVIALCPENAVLVVTRKGKRRTLSADDPALRRAGWLERLLLRHRFPTPALPGRDGVPTS